MRNKLRIRSTAVAVALSLLCLVFIARSVSAQELDPPQLWQSSARGLSVQQNADLKTGGLGFVVQVQDWPFLRLRGGVANSGSYRGPRLDGPVSVELGKVRVPGYSATLVTETTDWAHNEMVFRYGNGSEFTMWVSRLSPAVLIHSQAGSLDLFSGALEGNEFYTNEWGSLAVRGTSALSFPKYLAYPTASGVSVTGLSSSGVDLSSAVGNWILLWYGGNSHFLNSKMPLSYEWTVPLSEGYRGDVPLLIVFENQPAAIAHSEEGGVRISHPSNAGHIAVLPLFGKDIPHAADTENWSQALPVEVLQRVQWWAEHLCMYPIGAREAYGYHESIDEVAITEVISYETVCSGGSIYAPIPPMLGLVHDVLGVDFSGPLANGQLDTEYGPTLGVEGVDHYTWRVSGLNRYVDAKRVILDTGSPPSELEEELAAELQKIISAGHMAPWIFTDGIPQNPGRGDLYWANPADAMYHLLETVDVVKDESLRGDLVDYISAERMDYPPEYVHDLPLTEGALREPFSCYESRCQNAWLQGREDSHLRRVPLYNLYAVARYYDLINDRAPTETWQTAQDILSHDMQEQDWATFYWFDNFDDRRVAVRNANRHFAGMVGYIRLAREVGDTSGEALGRAFLAKAAALRLGMAVYPRYLYSAGLVHLPESSDWHPSYVREPDIGYLYNLCWAQPSDDARQVAILNQFGVHLRDHSGYMKPGTGWDEWASGPGSAHLTAFHDLVPELARMLSDLVGPDVEAYVVAVERLFPHWYAAFAEATLGAEHNLNHPVDSFQIFMAKSLLQEERPERLLTYVDIPWVHTGDLFYVHKLAEAIKSYRGVVWSDTLHLAATPDDGSLHLTWQVFTELPASTTWQISYRGPAGDQPSPISSIPNSTRSYELTGLANYAWYTVTLSALSDGVPFLTSNEVVAMPTNRTVCLPLVLKARR